MIFGDLVFCVHFVVLFQSCCTIVAVSGKTSSTPAASTATSTARTTTIAIGGRSSNATTTKPSSPNSARKGYAAAKQKYDLPGELGQYCSALEDCRQYAYMCDSRKQSCECAEGYQPDEGGKLCIGAVGKRCLYDSHCIPNAYCKGQMICTCKREFGYLSPDKWSCQASAADSLHSRKWSEMARTKTTTTTMLLAASAGGVIIIPLLLVSSWQLEINLFTV